MSAFIRPISKPTIILADTLMAARRTWKRIERDRGAHSYDAQCAKLHYFSLARKARECAKREGV